MKLVHQITAAMLTTMLLVVALVAASMYVGVVDHRRCGTGSEAPPRLLLPGRQLP
jgi:hypothetical protein